MNTKLFGFFIALVSLTNSLIASETAEVVTNQTKGVDDYVTYFLAMGIAAAGCGIGQSKVVAAALDGIARNPSANDKLFTPMILGCALIESLLIFTFVSIFMVK